ncbi:MAG: hypothetical protein ABIY70_11120 [Capsulimonas sp.]|uniref:hypothetical protein n=1 Tax=Capsulimonas sp. TaxID=2494211 RepID=UPI0032640603
MLKSRYYAWLIPYIEGTLDAGRRHLLEKRMAADPKLAAEMDTLRRVTSHLRRSASSEPPPTDMRPVWPRVQSRLQKRGPAPLVSSRLAWGGAVSVAVGFMVAANMRTEPLNYLPPVQNYSGDHAEMMAAAPISDRGFQLRARSTQPVTAAPAAPTVNAFANPDRVVKIAIPAHPAMWLARNSIASGEGGGVQYAAAGLVKMPHSGASFVMAKTTSSISSPALPAAAPSVVFAAKVAPALGQSVHGNASVSDAADSVSMNASRMADHSDSLSPSGTSALDAMAHRPVSDMDTARLPGSYQVASASSNVLGMLGASRFFATLPAGAKAAHRPSDIVSAVRPRSLTAAQSVDVLRAEAYGQQSRGQFSSALDTWRDAVFVSIAAPTYSDEASVKQVNETLAAVRDAGQLENLRERLERQQEFAPDDIVNTRALGYIYTLTGDVELARAVWRQVTQSGFETGEDWYQLAGAELIDGDTTSARVAYEFAVRSGALPLTSTHRAIAQRWLSNPLH